VQDLSFIKLRWECNVLEHIGRWHRKNTLIYWEKRSNIKSNIKYLVDVLNEVGLDANAKKKHV
jgi:hypothetical protein